MKKYHECGRIINECDDTTGFFIREGGIANGKDNNGAGKWIYKNNANFEGLVMVDQVQYFAWGPEGLCIAMTDEEIEAAKAAGIAEERVIEYSKLTADEFLRKDLTYEQEAIKFAFSDSKSMVAGSLIAVKLGENDQEILTIYVVGAPWKLEDLTRRVQRSGAAAEVHWQAGDNSCVIYVTSKSLDKVVNNMGIRVAVSPKTLEVVAETESFVGFSQERVKEITNAVSETKERIMKLYRKQTVG